MGSDLFNNHDFFWYMDPKSVNKLRLLEEFQFCSFTQISLKFH